MHLKKIHQIKIKIFSDYIREPSLLHQGAAAQIQGPTVLAKYLKALFYKKKKKKNELVPNEVAI